MIQEWDAFLEISKPKDKKVTNLIDVVELNG